MTYDCRTRYSVCVPCILWCYNTKSVPLYVSSIHDFVMVHTGTAWYVLLYFVCRSMYRYILVCTLVHTRYPVPVHLVMIPDAVTGGRAFKFKLRQGLERERERAQLSGAGAGEMERRYAEARVKWKKSLRSVRRLDSGNGDQPLPKVPTSTPAGPSGT